MATKGSYTVTAIAIEGRAKRARVVHTAPDGRTATREYSWPADITREAMLIALGDLHRRFLAEPAAPPVLDDTLDLVGTPIAPEE